MLGKPLGLREVYAWPSSGCSGPAKRSEVSGEGERGLGGGDKFEVVLLWFERLAEQLIRAFLGRNDQ